MHYHNHKVIKCNITYVPHVDVPQMCPIIYSSIHNMLSICINVYTLIHINILSINININYISSVISGKYWNFIGLQECDLNINCTLREL